MLKGPSLERKTGVWEKRAGRLRERLCGRLGEASRLQGAVSGLRLQSDLRGRAVRLW